MTAMTSSSAPLARLPRSADPLTSRAAPAPARRAPLGGLFALALAALALAGCGASGSDGDSGGPAGPSRPAGNGVAIGEPVACARYELAIENRKKDLHCTASTGVACPDLIRLQASEPTCASWDEGTVKGCEDFFAKETRCEALSAAGCVITPIAGTGTGASACGE